MSKSFFEMMDAVFDEYYEARSKTIVGVDMAHYYTTLKHELSFNVMQWFIRHVENVSGNKNEIIGRLTEKPTTPTIKHPPTNKTGLNL